MAANLGKIVPKPKNKWVIGLEYKYLDIVTHNGNSYIAMRDNAVEPSDDGVNWQLLVEGTPIATEETLGKVKPDGKTITIEEDGTLHGASQVPPGVTYIDLEGTESTLPERLLANADTLGGQAPEYYATAQEIEELDNQLKTQYVSNNTSMRSDDLSTAGWYRIARYETQSMSAMDGATAFGCDLVLRMGFGTVNNSSHHIKFINAYGNFHFIPIADITNSQTLTKIRLCKTPQERYIEVFYNREVSNNLNLTISSAKDNLGYWNTIRSELTEESAEGCTYYAVTDIPKDYIPFQVFNNPNFLINPDFSVNQRGMASYTGTGSRYTVDRWRALNGKTTSEITPTDSGAHINISGEDWCIGQNVESYACLAGKTVTMSARVSCIGSWRIFISDTQSRLYSKDFSDYNGIVTLTVALGSDISRLLCAFHCLSETVSSIDIEWVKLEEGSVATPFIPPDPATELMKCRRYFIPVLSNDLHGTMISTQIANAFMNFSAMRVIPTVSWLNPRLTIAGVGHITSITLSATAKNSSLSVSAKTSDAYEKYQSCSITVSDGDIVGYLDAEIY